MEHKFHHSALPCPEKSKTGEALYPLRRSGHPLFYCFSLMPFQAGFGLMRLHRLRFQVLELPADQNHRHHKGNEICNR
ncbi:MAG TPA: hypothetical protein H9905_09330, partial [Candidatus Faecalibacterium intestinipullorum]|nr:hypothetical protein [Candidatus Faecalibacterium intestinipullorum]